LPQQADNKAKLEIQLNLTQSGPYVFHGQNGYSIKSANGKHASHYYSAPFIEVAGLFTFKNKLNESTSKPVSGIAWFDQEWTSQLLDTDTQGWDWLSLHLDNGSKIMAFRMRLKNQPDYITGSYIDAKGQLTTLAPEDLSLSPESSTELTMADGSIKSVPLIWKLRIPSKDIDLVIEALKKDQWNPALISYYEGMVSIKGSHLGKGFLELTGY
jgi:predicted secreted hydrolase